MKSIKTEQRHFLPAGISSLTFQGDPVEDKKTSGSLDSAPPHFSSAARERSPGTRKQVMASLAAAGKDKTSVAPDVQMGIGGPGHWLVLLAHCVVFCSQSDVEARRRGVSTHTIPIKKQLTASLISLPEAHTLQSLATWNLQKKSKW